MTNRQLAWHRLIAPKVSDMIDSARRELDGKPVGWLVIIRLSFWPQGVVQVAVMREQDQILYREYAPTFRKGDAQPKFRPLCELQPVSSETP